MRRVILTTIFLSALSACGTPSQPSYSGISPYPYNGYPAASTPADDGPSLESCSRAYTMRCEQAGYGNAVACAHGAHGDAEACTKATLPSRYGDTDGRQMCAQGYTAYCATSPQTPGAPVEADTTPIPAAPSQYGDSDSRELCAQGYTAYCENSSQPTSSAAAPDNAAPAPVAMSDNVVHVPLGRTASGSLVVKASIDGSPPLPFILDSGADVVVLPFALARALAQSGLLAADEFAGLGVAGLAGGGATHTIRLQLHSVNLGGVEVHEVECMVVAGGEPLLGQSVLREFKSWSVDNQRGTLDIL